MPEEIRYEKVTKVDVDQECLSFGEYDMFERSRKMGPRAAISQWGLDVHHNQDDLDHFIPGLRYVAYPGEGLQSNQASGIPAAPSSPTYDTGESEIELVESSDSEREEPSAPTNTFRAYKATFGNPAENIYHPYRSKLDWDLANWANRHNPGSNALLELLAIPGVVEKLDVSYSSSREMNKIVNESLPDPAKFLREEVGVKGAKSDVYLRELAEYLGELFGKPGFAPYLRTAPEKHYKDETMSERVYHDTNTATFWWNAQIKLDARRKQGGTIAPLIFASDKSQITLFRNKAAYPVYMTTANIPKEIRRKPSSGARVLVGYFQTTKLEHITNKASRRHCMSNLFHVFMRHIVRRLKTTGNDGVMMATGNGTIYRVYPLFAGFVGDNPEQVLAACCKTGLCFRCTLPRDKIGVGTEEYLTRRIVPILEALSNLDDDLDLDKYTDFWFGEFTDDHLYLSLM
ncbi:hypothetical protein BDV98DRAFT_608376 [Pterulicium gracile]|uniref:Uncharacterized protein n=1 Tax=Pterulicium gracile TaxID=1884261 RepID=A0A5C3Q415_9AGAR|nr:hypothetical protein BDV98DRAFT_608376 [Pterula gracilis]